VVAQQAQAEVDEVLADAGAAVEQVPIVRVDVGRARRYSKRSGISSVISSRSPAASARAGRVEQLRQQRVVAGASSVWSRNSPPASR
jgi:hypothetical protein